MVSRIYGLADEKRRTMPPLSRIGKHRMSGAVAQALWLRSQKFFHSFFPWVLGMIPSNFQIEISEKNLGKNSPQGSAPQKFWKSRCVPPRVMCLHNFIQISQKLYPVGLSNIRATKKQNDKTCRCLSETGSPIAASIYRWIELGAHNFSPKPFYLHSLPVLHNI